MIITSTQQRKKMKRAAGKPSAAWDERVWSYLVADMLCISNFRHSYLRRFCDIDIPIEYVPDVWLESQPLSPRKGHNGNTEGNSVLDLAFGAIRQRGKTHSGIEFDPGAQTSWVCFVEAKIHADISASVRYDPNKNQIARVIENLLCFQTVGHFPDRLFFALITPRAAQQSHGGNKLYHQIMAKYRNSEKVLRDINCSPFPRRNQPDWHYPESLSERLKRLSIKWITFEDIFEQEFGIRGLDITQQPILPQIQARLDNLANSG
jgi:hypothetical protein